MAGNDTSVAVADVGRVPLSAQTHTSTFASRQAYGAGLTKRIAEAIAPTRAVACRYSTDADWVIVASPTLRLATEALHPAVLNIGNIETLWDECKMAYSVIDLAASAQPFDLTPGILNSTDALRGISPIVESKVADLFTEAQQAWFEDGVESDFSRGFSTLVHLFGDTAVAAAQILFSSPSTKIEVAIEAAHGLGEIDHTPSLRYRRSLLELLVLTAASVRLRHGAAAGLASMDDPSSLPAMYEAYARESNQRLRQYLQLVVEQLERTRACLTS